MVSVYRPEIRRYIIVDINSDITFIIPKRVLQTRKNLGLCWLLNARFVIAQISQQFEELPGKEVHGQ